MIKKSSICSAIEGMKLSFNTRQFYSSRPFICEILGKRVYPFKLGINGYVKIEIPLENPRETAAYTTSLTMKGDAVQGGSIDGWTSKPIKPTILKNATSTHSAEFGVLNGHSYAHVQSSHRDHLQSADIQARHPQVIEIINPVYHPDNVID